MSNYEKLQEEYAAVYPAYERLAEFLQRLLRKHLDEGGHRLAEVSSRAKDPASFVKKAMRKGYQDPMASIGDKAGGRIVTPSVAIAPRSRRFAARSSSSVRQTTSARS